MPIYRQITDQVKVAVATGQISRGEKLPSVRAMSEALVINPTTVQRAFLDLERDGVVETRRGQGTFVLADGVALPDDERRRRASEHLGNAVAEGHRLQLKEQELNQLFEEEVRRVYGNGRANEPETGDQS